MVVRHRESINDPEEKFELFRNGTTETIPAGAAVYLSLTVADGVSVGKAVAASLGLFVGIADVDAAPGAFVRVQRQGWRSVGALVRNDAVTNIDAGDYLVPVVGEWYMIRGGAASSTLGWVTIVELYTAGVLATVLKRVFIRAT